jgi:hypothetical protein
MVETAGGVFDLEVAWARITELHTLEDNVVLGRALDRLAACGIHEAHNAPIVDAAPPTD